MKKMKQPTFSWKKPDRLGKKAYVKILDLALFPFEAVSIKARKSLFE
jgi:hypothetical protein